MDIDEANPFADMPTIYTYTRAMALEDGALVDVSDKAKEAGFVFPVAVSEDLWHDIETIPLAYSHESVPGRLWDVLYMAHMAIRRAPKDGSMLLYNLILHTAEPPPNWEESDEPEQEYTVKLVCGPGDEGEPVITLMRPDES